MNRHNEEVLECLNDFLKVNKPGYAVLIKGSWGCGKTFYVKKWLKTLSTKTVDNDDYLTLAPIYISLYGLSSTSQIDEEIKRIVSPILHSKAMKTLGKVFQVAISAAIRYNVDFNNDSNADMNMTCTIDPKALLGSNNPHVKGNRLLVFDDLERSKMNIQEVLGYINYYVEHIGCNVVIVGDVAKLKDSDDYKNIKEKTIGREFVVDPDIDEAVDSFVNDEYFLGKDYLSGHKDVIKNCFKASKTNNLRLLKQSLNDFGLMVNRMPEDIKRNPSFEIIKLRLLANFVAVYAEDKGQDVGLDEYGKKLSEEVADQMAIDFTGKGEPSSREMTKKHSKYEKVGLTDRYYAMVPHYAECVLVYLRKGKIDLEFIKSELQKDNKQPWDVLENYMSLENGELSNNVDLNAGFLESGIFDSVDQMLRSATVMLFIIHWNLSPKYSVEKVNTWCSKIMRDNYYGKCKSQNELHEMRDHVLRCMSYYTMGSKMDEIDSFLMAMGDVYREVESSLKTDLTDMLESLSDDKIDDLYKIYGGSMPDHSTSYSDSPIFSKVDPVKFVKSYAALKNESKNKVCSLIISHYSEALDIQKLEDMVYHYVDDLNTLPTIIELLRKEADECQLVDRLNINILTNNLEKSVEKIRKADEIRKHELG